MLLPGVLELERCGVSLCCQGGRGGQLRERRLVKAGTTVFWGGACLVSGVWWRPFPVRWCLVKKGTNKRDMQ